jgi:hypothetical protein
LRLLALLAVVVGSAGAPAQGAAAAGGGPSDSGARPAAASPPSPSPAAILAPAGRTTTVVVEDDVGHPLERESDFVAAAPSYRRAIASDRDQQWAEAVGLYQQALIELAAAAQLKPPQQLETAAFKVDLERRRSRALAEDTAAPSSSGARSSGAGASSPRLLPLERGRLLRQKLMAVRAATGSTPEALRSATQGALTRALQDAEHGAAARDPRQPAAPEVRLLLCATLAVSGDRAGARLQLAALGAVERSDPARALTLAACQAALGYRDDALASLAVAVNRLGPSSKFLPGPSREIQSYNDWDPLRRDPRFLRLFR